jgi:hypothetical protein
VTLALLVGVLLGIGLVTASYADLRLVGDDDRVHDGAAVHGPGPDGRVQGSLGDASLADHLVKVPPAL